MSSRIPMVKLSPEEIAQIQQRTGESPSQAARALRVDERTVCKALAGYPVHRSTAVVLRQFLNGSSGSGRI